MTTNTYTASFSGKSNRAPRRVQAERFAEAAEIFAERFARRMCGSAGVAKALRFCSAARDGGMQTWEFAACVPAASGGYDIREQVQMYLES